MIARVYFYMHDRYDLNMSRQQQQLFLAWHRQFPVSAWERERDKRIAARMGYHNPFVTGEAAWRALVTKIVAQDSNQSFLQRILSGNKFLLSDNRYRISLSSEIGTATSIIFQLDAPAMIKLANTIRYNSRRKLKHSKQVLEKLVTVNNFHKRFF